MTDPDNEPGAAGHMAGDISPRHFWEPHRLFGVLLLSLPFAGWLTTGSFLLALLIPTVLFIILAEAEALLAPRFERRPRNVAIVAFRLAHAALIVLGVHATAPWPWLTPLLIGLLLLQSALVLPGRPLIVVVGICAVANIAAAVLAERGILVSRAAVEFAEPGVVEMILVSLIGFPAGALFLHLRGSRTTEMRTRLERSVRELRAARDELEGSQEQLRRWNRQLNAEVDRQTKALEERNRYLSIINAVSFALAEPMDDARALERAVRLVARLLGMRAAQAYTRPRGGEVLELFVTVAPEDLYAPRLPEVLLHSVAQTGRPLTSSHPDWEPDVELPDLGEPYHVVPLVAKGRVLGSFALVGEGTLRSDDDGRHLLLLVGREMGVALENARLYQEAIEKAAREEFLTDVTRVLNGTGRGERALPGVLDSIRQHLNAREAVLVSLPDGTRDVEVAGTALVEGATTAIEPLARALSRIVIDRGSPLVLGRGGEGNLSERLVAEGLTTVAVAPIFSARGTSIFQDPVHGPDAGAPAVKSMASLVGALIVCTADGEEWGHEQTSLLDRLANIMARRIQADEMVAIQQQRIRELTGLAEVARTMQSGADVERLYSGFATALSRLLSYQQLTIARVDENGSLTEIPTFGARGRPVPVGTADTADSHHPWFSSRVPILWRRGDNALPGFVPDDVRYAAVVPMRPKGQMLGLAVVALPRQIRPDQVHILEQAVEQLSLALDSASLYQQATARASHIQALSNLARIVASVVNLREAFSAFSEEVRWLIPFDRAVMFLLDESGEMVEPYATYPEEVSESAPERLADSIANVAIQAGEAVAIRRDDPRYAGLDWSLLGFGAREVAAVPIRQGTATAAVFALVSNNAGDYALSELDALEEVAGLLAVTIERLRLYEQADYGAKHDLLTGLPNYRYLQERLSDLHQGIDHDGTSALLVVDMDNLKTFNDTLGHEVGDRVIEIVARELRAACRFDDVVARTGGDEFVIVMEGAGIDAAVAVGDRIHEALHAAHEEIEAAPARIGVSIGIAISPDDARTTAELIQAADQAMYDAKFAGGQRTRTAAQRDPAGTTRAMRGRSMRLADSLVRTLTAGATVDELAALSVANRWLGSIMLRLAAPPEVIPQLRLVVASQAARRLSSPRQDRDQSLAHYLVGRIYNDWKQLPENGGAETVTILVPAILDIAWMMLPRPAGEGMTVERALARFVETYPQAAMHQAWPVIEDVVRSTMDRRREVA